MHQTHDVHPPQLHVLGPDQWPSYQRTGELPATLREGDLVLALLDQDARIIGRWIAQNVVALEGLWIDPVYRHNPRIAKTLLTTMMDILRRKGVAQAVTLVNSTQVAKLALTAGFELVPGSVWQISLKE